MGSSWVPTGQEYYARGGTGSWWRQSPTGNTWGWEDGNWPQMAAIAHAILPTEFALPIVQQLEVFAEAEYIAGANVNCEFNCADVLGYLGRWLMFSTPLTDLLAGTTYPDTVNASNPDYDPDLPIGPDNSLTTVLGRRARCAPGTAAGPASDRRLFYARSE